MASIIAGVIAMLAGAVVGLLARRVERRPPTWAVGLAVGSLIFPIANIGLAAWMGLVLVGLPFLGAERVFAVNVQSGETRTLVAERGEYGACDWSPDGERVAVAGMRTHDWGARILVVHVQTGDVAVLGDGSDSPERPAWSPDGQMIAYWATRTVGGRSLHQALAVIDAEGGEPRDLMTRDVFSLGTPQWSPDGTTIAVSRPGLHSWVQLVSLAGGSSRRLGRGGLSPQTPTWSPDGSRLAFASLGMDGTGLYVTSRDGRELRQLAAFSPNEATWSPQGDRIAYLSYAMAGRDLWTVAPDGSASRRLAGLPNAQEAGDIAWSPDGTRLALWAFLGQWPEILVVDAQTGKWKSVATVYTDQPMTVSRPPPDLLQTFRTWLRTWLQGVPPSPPPAFSGPPDISWSPPEPFSWSPDSKWIAFSTRVPELQTRQRAESAAAVLLLLLFGLAGPTALCAAIWTWVKQGRSVATVLCVVAAALPTVLGGLVIMGISSLLFGI
jgi:Tol biopolymer transport system component